MASEKAVSAAVAEERERHNSFIADIKVCMSIMVVNSHVQCSCIYMYIQCTCISVLPYCTCTLNKYIHVHVYTY